MSKDYLFATEYQKDGKMRYGDIKAQSRAQAEYMVSVRNPTEKVVGIMYDVRDIDTEIIEYHDERVDSTLHIADVMPRN